MADNDDKHEEKAKKAQAYDNAEKAEEALDALDEIDTDVHSGRVEEDVTEAEISIERAKEEMEDDASTRSDDE